MMVLLFIFLCSIGIITDVVNGETGNTPVFGTKNGYDVGGIEPLCFQSIFPDQLDNDENDFATNQLERLNQLLFEAGDDAQVTLLPSCYEGTNMSMTPLDDLKNNKDSDNVPIGAHENQLYTNEIYTFRLEAEVDIAKAFTINNNFTDELIQNFTENGFVSIYCRLHLCDALRQGFCNPLADTREADYFISRTDADLINDDVPQIGTNFAQNETKWKYAEGIPLIGWTNKYQDNDNNGIENSDERLYTRWIQWKLRLKDTNSTIYRAQVDMSLYINEDTIPRGLYFFLGHLVVDFNLGNGSIQRLDITQTIPEKIVEVRAPPIIKEVSDGCKIWLSVVICIIGTFALYCFIFIIYNRNHAVMRLAQGTFLAAMAGSCLIQTVCTFTYLPTQDIFCYLRGPLVQVPMTFVGAILVGRVYRVYNTLSAANAMGRFQQQPNDSKMISTEKMFVRILEILANSITWIIPAGKSSNSSKRSSTSRSIRRTVTSQETSGLIIMLTLPQLIFQIIRATLWEGGLDTEFASDGNVGRVVCGCANGMEMTGFVITAFIYFLAVIMAWISRDLPSAFNEKDQIFKAATIGSILAIIFVSLGRITDDPTTDPDVNVFLQACVSIGIAASVLIIIIWPKIQRVRSGDDVVMSNLLGSRFGSNVTPTTSLTSQSTGSSPPVITEQTESTTNGSHSAYESTISKSPRNSNRLQLNVNDAMPLHIERDVVDLQFLLRNITNQSSDGRPLTVEDWKRMREEVYKLKTDLDLLDFGDDDVESDDKIKEQSTSTRKRDKFLSESTTL